MINNNTSYPDLARYVNKPIDYYEVKEEIMTMIKKALESGAIKKAEEWLWQFIPQLPFQKKWSRAQVYFLLRDLIEFNLDLYPGFDDLLYDMVSGIVGDCSPESIIQYPDEPSGRETLALFVRGYHWF